MNKFRIIKIISEYEVVINGGSESDVHEGEIFKILVTGNPIIDPVTNESLGTLDYMKGQIKVVNVFEKFSICSHVEQNNPMKIMTSSHIFGRVPAKLNVKPEQITGDFDNYDKMISIGDWVYRVSDSDSLD